MRSGTVAWFDPERGVGGVVEDGSDRQLAVHAAAIDGGGSQSSRARDRVRFTVSEGGGGARDARLESVKSCDPRRSTPRSKSQL